MGQPQISKPHVIEARSHNRIALDIVRLLGKVEGKDLVYSNAVTASWVLSAIVDSSNSAFHWDFWHSAAGLTLMANQARELADEIAKFQAISASLKAKVENLRGPLADFLFMPPIARHVPLEVSEEFLFGYRLGDKARLLEDLGKPLERLGRMRRDCERQQPPPIPTTTAESA